MTGRSVEEGTRDTFSSPRVIHIEVIQERLCLRRGKKNPCEI